MKQLHLILRVGACAAAVALVACTGGVSIPQSGDSRAATDPGAAGDQGNGGDGSSSGDPSVGDPAAGDPSGGDNATGDPAAGDGTGGDPTGGDPTGGDPTGGDPTGGDPAVPTRPDRIGIFSLLNNYVELDTLGGPLRFHFGSSLNAWGSYLLPVAGDWDNDGLDTIALYEPVTSTFFVADENDSDEWGPRGSTARISGMPAPPPPRVAEGAVERPLSGDWNGDGTDGIGVYHFGSNTFYLRQTATNGADDVSLTLDTADGYPAGGWPLAGDWDGDGDDEVGLFDGTTVYLRNSLSVGPPDLQYAAAGYLIAGDFDGDGVDTLALFDTTDNTYYFNNTHSAGTISRTRQFGFADRDYWIWLPVIGNWQEPASAVAGSGYPWTVEAPGAHNVNATALGSALTNGGTVADVLSTLVVRDGVLIGEAYYHGYERHIAGNIKSVSKGVLSALFGIAIDQGVFTGVDDTVASHLPTYFQSPSDPQKLTITLGDVLTMRGGLDWFEFTTSIGDMLAAPDYVEYVVSQPITTTIGGPYNYSTGLTMLGSATLSTAASTTTRGFARSNLFEPLGISAPRWDRDPQGTFIGGAEMWMRPRDMARFGQLFLRNGNLGGNQIVSQSWVESSADPWVPEGGRFYGLWWRERSWANYPGSDSFFAWGHGGQFIFLFPSWDLMVVVTSKWNVDGAQSGAASDAIFSFVDGQILTSVTP